MDIQSEKLELIKKLLETNDEYVIESIKSVFKKGRKDFWKDLNEKQRFDIEESDRQIEKGDFYLYDDVMKKHRK
jgi:hypothetical protein